MSDTILGVGNEAWSKRQELATEQVLASMSNERIRSCTWKYFPDRFVLLLKHVKVLAALRELRKTKQQ